MSDPSYGTEIRGQRFEVPIHIDEATTKACVDQVAQQYAHIESEAVVINTQVFALQTAYHFAKECSKLRAAHAGELESLREEAEAKLADAQGERRDLETETLDALGGLSKALRALLNDLHTPPPETLKFPKPSGG